MARPAHSAISSMPPLGANIQSTVYILAAAVDLVNSLCLRNADSLGLLASGVGTERRVQPSRHATERAIGEGKGSSAGGKLMRVRDPPSASGPMAKRACPRPRLTEVSGSLT